MSKFIGGFIATFKVLLWSLIITLCILVPFFLVYFSFWYLLLYLITIPLAGGLIAMII